jgi:signal transduction histidine kinase
MYGRVSAYAIGAWVLFVAVTVLARKLFVCNMKTRVSQGKGFRATLRGEAALAVPTGALSGTFAWLYFDAQQPLTMVILGTYMTVVIVGGVIPTAVYLPAFYLFALSAHLPYLLLLVMSGGGDHLVIAGINVLFLIVVSKYAADANQMHRESTRLRYENQNLVDDLELRRADAENALRGKSLFLAGVSHDLKQPIRAIALYARSLRHGAEQDSGPKDVIQTAEKIEAAVGAIHNHVSRLLQLSRLESGTMPMHLESVALDDTFALVRDLMTSLAQVRGVQLHFIRGRQRQVLADRRMLESILSNFVSNAIKHSEGGRVYVGTRLRIGYPEGQQLCIEVRDNGSGIPAQQIPLLFDAYRSFDDRDASESHGLGLAMAKAQASYLGCEVDVRSAPGCGSTFTLCGLRAA